MARVVMLIHEEDGAYGASFPDFPGATTVAGDLDTLYRKAARCWPSMSAAWPRTATNPRARTLDALRGDPASARTARARSSASWRTCRARPFG